ncbi:hypothetical protein DL765_004379 [Monosporascus sp. GIB2]|nr:hypothetical protein DL765_004379 [Monosporascus sp. GIB2]
MPEGQYGGIVQYDLGKDLDGAFRLKGFLSPPPSRLMSAVGRMRSDHLVAENKVDDFVSTLLQKSRRLTTYKRPSSDMDVLFDADYPHPPTEPTCENCDKGKLIHRRVREADSSEIHYGLIASGDRVMRCAVKRDILCFEMGDGRFDDRVRVHRNSRHIGFAEADRRRGIVIQTRSLPCFTLDGRKF